jgi:hypothetical protein
MEASVGAINRYPVKSMLGERLEQAVVGAGGLLGDRGYAVVDVADGKVGSAKNPGKWRGLLAFRAEYLADPEPDQPPPPALISLPNGGQIRTDAPDIDAVLSKLLDRPVRLDVSVPTPTAPLVLDEVWPDIDGLAPEEFVESTRVGSTEVGEAISAIPMAMFAPPGSFFDLTTLHLLTTATLAHLQELEPAATFDVRRYRPNVLVETDDSGFVENDWVGGRVGLGSGLVASVVMPTMRCVMTTLAQEDLPQDRATLKTVARHNRLDIPGFGTWACAGVYATVESPGEISVGDPVTVL